MNEFEQMRREFADLLAGLGDDRRTIILPEDLSELARRCRVMARWCHDVEIAFDRLGMRAEKIERTSRSGGFGPGPERG